MREFSVEISPDVGFTDQLNQLFILYTLATQLGLRYVPSPIVTRRNLSPIWNDLNLCEYLSQSPSASNNEKRVSTIVKVHDHRNGVRYSHVSEVLADLRATISKIPPGDVLLFQLAGNRNVLTRVMKGLPSSAFEHFRQTFDTALVKSSFSSPFTSGPRVRILFHIRKGDTARIETPWVGPLNFWHNQAAISVSQRPEDVTILRAIARKLTTEFAPEDIELIIFSDGYLRTASLLNSALSKSIVFSGERKDFIRALLVEKEAELELFAAIPNTQLFLGEGYDEFKKLLIGLRDADVIITNGMQRLPSKVIGALPARTLTRNLVVVGPDLASKSYFTDCIFNQRNFEYVPVSWNRFSMNPILKVCRDALVGHGISGSTAQTNCDNARSQNDSLPEYIVPEHYNNDLAQLLRNASNLSEALGQLNEALSDIARLKRAMPADKSLDQQHERIIKWISWVDNSS